MDIKEFDTLICELITIWCNDKNNLGTKQRDTIKRGVLELEILRDAMATVHAEGCNGEISNVTAARALGYDVSE